MKDETNAVEIENLVKSFKLYKDKSNTLKETIIHSNRKKYKVKSVLNGISFSIKKGQAVGLIGCNGCGKSTTLKLISKIIFPDNGNIETCGRVSSLIELGAGFHPDMSGRENIYTNSAIFGLNKKEIEQRIDTIIDFSELRDYIDNPVRTYSSGMYMRLAFSVAINVDADILLIDEILAVGDVNFQKKCLDKIKEIKEQGTTIVIVSHSLSQIQETCDRVIWLENGKIREDGEANLIIENYSNLMEERRLEKIRKERGDDESLELAFNKLTIRNGNGAVRFKSIHLYDKNFNKQNRFNVGDDILVIAKYENYSEEIKDVSISFSIAKTDGTLCYATSTTIEGVTFGIKKNGEIKIIIRKCPLLVGTYLVNVALSTMDGLVLDDLQRGAIFNIESSKMDFGVCRIQCEWE